MEQGLALLPQMLQSIEILQLTDVSRANVGQILNSLRRAGRRHALILGKHELTGTDEICGIFSLTRVCGLVGLDVQRGAPMAEIERALHDVLD